MTPLYWKSHASRILAHLLLAVIPAGAAAQLGPTPNELKSRTQACTVCHGDQGRASAEGYYPRIAGKPRDYLFNQLVHFREGRRSHTTMNYLVENLSDDYLLRMADYFSQQHPPYPKPAPLRIKPEALEQGKRLVLQGDPARKLPACTSCHGEQLTGIAPFMPGLIGLPRDYINAQMGAWLKGQRKAAAPDCMAHIVKTLSTEELSMVSSYLALQPIPKDAKPQLASTRPFPMECGTHKPMAPQSRPSTKAFTPEAGGSTGAPVNSSKPIESQGQAKASPAGSSALSASIERGAYLSKLGNCVGCHTSKGSAPYSGGRGIETPFGTVYSTNLTPATKTGLGSWTAEEFYQALHLGKSRDGTLLYPAFPYTNTTWMSRAETDDLLNYLRSLPAVEQNIPAAHMRFPFNQRALIAIWQALYFKPGEYQAQPEQSKIWNRGNYLVNGPGHCNACHTPRGALGGLDLRHNLSGASIPVLDWYAPALNSHPVFGLGKRSEEELLEILKAGQSEKHAVYGPMAEVVKHSLQHWTDEDLKSAVHYLQSLPPQASSEKPPKSQVPQAAESSLLGRGGPLYTTHCADCHGQQGEGKTRQFPALAGNPQVLAPNPVNAILMILNGGYAPSTQRNPYPHGMPPFRNVLKPIEVAAIASYIRNSWGNQASFVSELDVERNRSSAK